MFRQSGRKLILISGRHLGDLESVCPPFDLFDLIVAENGAVLYTPGTREKQVLAPPPNQHLLEELARRGIHNVSAGDCIISTWHPNETVLMEAIRDLGLELHVVFNKGAVMALPAGVNKQSGLQAALDALSMSPHNVIGVGDAENDHAFLQSCECAVAVANALPAVKETADQTTRGANGAGVRELIQMILGLKIGCSARRAIPIGTEEDRPISIPPFGSNLLVGGASGTGKSTFVAGWLEIMAQRKYQFCLIDPEGDYESFPDAVTVGDEKHPPSLDQVMLALEKPSINVVANLLGVSVADRPQFLDRLLPRLFELRARTGRPHWVVIDEAHHMLPPEWTLPAAEMAGALENILMITVHPDHISPIVLKTAEAVLAVGPAPVKVFESFANTIGIAPPRPDSGKLAKGEMLAWFPRTRAMHRVRIHPSHAERQRHKRHYSSGEMGPDISFYFRGPNNVLNLRARNLTMFLQLADGVDDETWLYHLRRGDYSRWFREAIKDERLAEEAAQVEQQDWLRARESRQRIKEAVERRYTAAV